MEETSSRVSMETEATKVVRKVADKKYLVAGPGIISRMKKSELLPFLLCHYNALEILDYLSTGELKGSLTTSQLINKLAFGTKLTREPKGVKRTIEIAPFDRLEELRIEVPQTEYVKLASTTRKKKGEDDFGNKLCKLCGSVVAINEEGIVTCAGDISCPLVKTGYEAPSIIEWNEKMS